MTVVAVRKQGTLHSGPWAAGRRSFADSEVQRVFRTTIVFISTLKRFEANVAFNSGYLQPGVRIQEGRNVPDSITYHAGKKLHSTGKKSRRTGKKPRRIGEKPQVRTNETYSCATHSHLIPLLHSTSATHESIWLPD